ncbi:MAG: TetR/AcrR family transcriptional regulator [Methanobacteriaceae archaeon]|jgi:AcrR family transcriptional regulator|nr:TetR/AcrR family transcriptional regulator [Methanobacteriaceae archaeon]
MSTRMQRKKEEKRKTILDAAEKLIAEDGFRDMTMDQVAKDADVAKGTVYLYFKNKNSLCAAVNARINKELNQVIKEKMDLYQTGLEKVVASGTATVEFCLKNMQKWKAITELYQMKFKDPEDPNVKEFLYEVNNMVQMMANGYRQGIKEGTIREDLDPVPTAIFNRMAFSNAITPTTEQNMLLKMNNINMQHYAGVAGELIGRSTRKDLLNAEDMKKNIKKTYENLEKDL